MCERRVVITEIAFSRKFMTVYEKGGAGGGAGGKNWLVHPGYFAQSFLHLIHKI